MDPWYLQNLVCPIDKTTLEEVNGCLISKTGNKYNIIDGIPIMLVSSTEHTLRNVAIQTLNANDNISKNIISKFYIDTLGISEIEKTNLIKSFKIDNLIDDVVRFIIGATNGNLYKNLIGKLDIYPIPEININISSGEKFLDIGCNWGRWCISAGRKGYQVIGIDPSIGAVLAARRVSIQLGLSNNKYLVADARFLPFQNNSFNIVHSYSVLQHFSKENVIITLCEIERVLMPAGYSLIQMPNFMGLRSLQHQLFRGFREAKNFEVRYWNLLDLLLTFRKYIDNSKLSIDCFFGLGLQESDLKLLSPIQKIIVYSSIFLKKINKYIKILILFADSIYIRSVK